MTETEFQQALQNALNHRQAGQAGIAAQIYKSLLQNDPNNIEVLTSWASLAYSVGNYGRAAGFLERVLTIEPQNVQAALDGCDIYIQQDVPWKALEIAKNALEALDDPNTGRKAALLTRYGTALRMLKRSHEALDAYIGAHDLKPDLDAKINLAATHADLNQPEQAKAILKEAMELAPQNTFTHFHYALNHDYKDGDTHIQTMTQMLETYPNADFDRARLCMSLGNAYHKKKDYENAFEHYEMGNDILRGCFEYSLQEDERLINDIQSCFKDDGPLDDYKPAAYNTRPVFIVGFPPVAFVLFETSSWQLEKQKTIL